MAKTSDTRTDEQKQKDKDAKHNFFLVKVDSGEKFDLGKGYWMDAFDSKTPFLMVNSYMIPLLLQNTLTQKVYPNKEVSPEDCFILAEKLCEWGLGDHRLMILKDDELNTAFEDPYVRERLKIPDHEEFKTVSSTKDILDNRSDEEKKEQKENPKPSMAELPDADDGVNKNTPDPRDSEDKNPATPPKNNIRQRNRDKS